VRVAQRIGQEFVARATNPAHLDFCFGDVTRQLLDFGVSVRPSNFTCERFPHIFRMRRNVQRLRVFWVASASDAPTRSADPPKLLTSLNAHQRGSLGCATAALTLATTS
jgi:hypothetical protein